jgi:hypothetical protein
VSEPASAPGENPAKVHAGPDDDVTGADHADSLAYTSAVYIVDFLVAKMIESYIGTRTKGYINKQLSAIRGQLSGRTNNKAKSISFRACLDVGISPEEANPNAHGESFKGNNNSSSSKATTATTGKKN